MSVIIIGGGVIGTTLAFRLAESRETVTLLEAQSLASGTTGATFSVNVATRKTPKEHFDLAIEGGHEHSVLVKDLGVSDDESTWIHPCGNYEWADDAYEQELLRDRVSRLKDWGYRADWITREHLANLEPHLTVDPDVDEIAYYPDGAWYDAPKLVGYVAERAKRLGAQVITGSEVTKIESTSAGVNVETAQGDRYSADRLVIAAGPESREIASLAGLNLPVDRVPGFVVYTEPVPPGTLNGMVSHSRGAVRPAPGGQILCNSYYVEGTKTSEALDNDSLDEITTEITDAVSSVLPIVGDISSSRARIGVRPVPADGLPIVGWLNDAENVYSVVTHSGVTFAPILAKYVTRELGGQPVDKLDTFRPWRESLLDPASSQVDESTREMRKKFFELRN